MLTECSNCHETLDVADDYAGQEVRCHRCKDVFLATAKTASVSEITEKPAATRPPPVKIPRRAEPEPRSARAATGSSSGLWLALGVIVVGGGLFLILIVGAGVGAYFLLREKPAEPVAAKDKLDKKDDDIKPIPPPVADPAVKNVATVQLRGSDLVYDPARGLILVTAENSVVAIDPAQEKRVWSIPLGNNATVMAISDNSEVVWVGANDRGTIQRVDLTQRIAGPQMPLGKEKGDRFVEKIEVIPRTTNSIVVSLIRPGLSPRHGGVAVYDNGVRRPKVTQDHTGANRIVFVGPRLFGYNNETTEFGLRRLDIDAEGVREGPIHRDVIDGFRTDIVAAGGWIYSTGGHVVDPERGIVINKMPARGAVAVDDAKQRAYYLDNGRIEAFDLVGQVKLGSLNVPNAADAPFGGGRLILIGGSGLAYLSNDGLVIVSRKLLP